MQDARAKFRGPMLTLTKLDPVTKQRIVHSIRVPDATRTLRGGKHPDGCDAVLHVAGYLIVTDADDVIDGAALHRKRLVIDDGSGSGAVCKADANLDKSVALRELTNHGKTGPASLRKHGGDFAERVAMEITFAGGTLSNDESTMSTLKYDLPLDDSDLGTAATGPIPLVKQWTPDGGRTPTITMVDQDSGEASKPRALATNETLFIFNWDHHLPTPAEFKDFTPTKCEPNTVIKDFDFRWLYQLLIARNDDWKGWLHSSDLPAPIFTCPERTGETIRTAPGSDCIDAIWHCD